MNLLKKIALIAVLFFPLISSAQESQEFANLDLGLDEQVQTDIIFEAEVIEITKEIENKLPDGSEVQQQNLKLEIYKGEKKGEIVDFLGIGSFDVIKKNIYKKGDRVLVVESINEFGEPAYYITDFIRTREISYLLIFFIAVLVLVGGMKGFRSIISLLFTFAIIVYYIVPQILSGDSPLLVTLIGSIGILLCIIYVTEGFRLRSHIAVVSISISLFLTIAISQFFVGLAKLSGVASEEVFYLMNIGDGFVNFKGLLLAGIIIGALGVLDDVVISQITTVEQLTKANPDQKSKELFQKAYEVGVSHISSMTNTLFLAYAGASLPLLVLVVSGESAFSGFGQVISNEAIATEIVRTLAGSIGLILSVPIATALAVYKFKKE